MNTCFRDVTQAFGKRDRDEMAPSLHCDCYISEYTGITRKGVASSLKSATLTLDREERRATYDLYGRYTTHARRSSRQAQSQTTYSQAVYRFRSIRSCQGWRWLQSEARSPGELHSQEQHEQINKAGINRQMTTNDLVAANSPLTDSAPAGVS